MLKIIQLKLARIKYKGQSIGEDIRVEIEALGKFLRIDKTIKFKTTSEINKEIGNFETEEKNFKINTKIVVIEKDLLFNDTGNANLKIGIDTTNGKLQQFSCEVEIKETRSILGIVWGKKTAIFEVILEAKVSDAFAYMPDNYDDISRGWTVVEFVDTKDRKPLPAYLRVKILKRENKKEYFKILEGPYFGIDAWISLKSDGSSKLIFGVERIQSPTMAYSISQKIFTLNNKKYKAIDDPSNPWEGGIYDIEIPSSPQPYGQRYQNITPRSKMWFRIGHSGEKFLHVGKVSSGCITIIEIEKWQEIYDALINSRKNNYDKDNVGIIEIID